MAKKIQYGFSLWNEGVVLLIVHYTHTRDVLYLLGTEAVERRTSHGHEKNTF